MKFNWGTGILIFLILFLIACGLFISFAMNQNINLVHKEYYQKGVSYTDQMEVDKRSAKYFNIIDIKDNGLQILIYFPENFSKNFKSGEIQFFRPSNSDNDYTWELKPDNNLQIIDKSKLIKGKYLVKINWESDENYFVEKEFIVK